MPTRLCRLAASISLAALAGCASTGASYFEHIKTLPPLAERQGRVVVHWDDEPVMGLTGRVVLFGDQKTFGMVYTKGFNLFDLPAGEHWMEPAVLGGEVTCRVQFQLKAGETQHFGIQVRKRASMDGIMALKIAMGPLASGVIGADKSCERGVVLEAMEASVASERLRTLRLTQETYQEAGQERSKPGR